VADVNVTYEQMQAAAQRLISGHEEITTQLTQLKLTVDELVQSGFVTDSASPKFENAYAEFNTGVTQTIEGLETLSGFLTTAAQSFQEQDQRLSGML
jgi:WXG100 family type VII secretion target